MKLLIAIVTCHRFRSRANAQRLTWIKDCNIDYKFFLGKADKEPAPDEVYLDVPDDYKSLPLKVQAACKWAVANGYDSVLKCDDDTYIIPSRLKVPTVPYSGRFNKSNLDVCPLGWCSGFAYQLTEPALSIVANAPKPIDTREDLWVGKLLNSKGIKCIDNRTLVVLSIISPEIWSCFTSYMVAACEFPEGKMLELHELLTNPRSKINPSPIPKTDLRFGRRIHKRRQ